MEEGGGRGGEALLLNFCKVGGSSLMDSEAECGEEVRGIHRANIRTRNKQEKQITILGEKVEIIIF